MTENEKRQRRAVGKRIRDLREGLGLNQHALAEKVGASQPALSRWEHGVGDMPLFVAGKIAKQLSVTVDWILRGKAAS